MTGRYLLILLAVLLTGSLGAFFMYVSILPALGVAVVLIGLVAMFGLGLHIGLDPEVAAAQMSLREWLAGLSRKMRDSLRAA